MSNVKYATGPNTQFAYVPEVTAGTTPASPSMVLFDPSKFDLTLDQTTLKDTAIYADRMERYVIAGQRKVGGTVEVQLSHSNWAPFLQTALWGTWASKVLVTGSTLSTLTLEEWHTDINVGYVHTGCFVDKFQIKCDPKGVVMLTMTVVGMNMTEETSALSGSPTAATVEIPFTTSNAVLTEGGTTIGIVTAYDISVDNSATIQDVIGNQFPIGFTPGTSSVTGNFSAYVPNNALMAKYIAQTPSSLVITLSDGTNTLTITLPAITYTGAKKSLQGQAAMLLNLPFTGVRDVATSTNIKIAYS